MRELLDQLLADEGGESALDLDPAAPQAPVPLPAARSGEQRLSAFDVADEDAEQRAHALRRLLGGAALAAVSAAAAAGSLVVGLS